MTVKKDKNKVFTFWVRYFKVVSIFFALLGIMWTTIGSFDPFGLYDKAFAMAFWNTELLPIDAKKTLRFILIPFGATNMGYFILQYFIVNYAYSHKQLWAYYSIVVGFFAWLILDTGMCLVMEGYFNIFFANVPSLILMIPIFFTRKYFTTNDGGYAS